MNEPKEKLWNSNYLKVMTANFLLFFAFYLLTPLLPLYLSERFSATKDVIGLVLSGYTVTTMLMRPFSGYVVDSFPRKQVLMVCFFVFFIFFAGYLAAGTLLLFAIVRTLHGAPYGAVTVANSTVAIDVLPSSRRTEGIGYYGLSNNLAMALAPSVALYIYHYVQNFDLLFVMSLVIAGIGLVVDATVKLNPRAIVKNKQKVSLDRFFLTPGWILAICMTGFGFCFGVLSNYLAIYSKEILHRTGGTGTWFMLISIGLMLSRLQGAKALRHGKIVQNASGGMCISVVGYTLFVVCPNDIGYFGSAILIGLGNGHMWPAFQNMFINLARNDQRGTANSSVLISWDIGMGLGVLIGGILANAFGYLSAFWTMVIVNVASVATFFAFARSHYNRHKLR
ncbi:MAG: MFS transporter [Muribaculaceae bacterium]|nr:MFS transporter [Muribaculaceae bacterium]